MYIKYIAIVGVATHGVGVATHGVGFSSSRGSASRYLLFFIAAAIGVTTLCETWHGVWWSRFCVPVIFLIKFDVNTLF
jgi:hypothetical protein